MHPTSYISSFIFFLFCNFSLVAFASPTLPLSCPDLMDRFSEDVVKIVAYIQDNDKPIKHYEVIPRPTTGQEKITTFSILFTNKMAMKTPSEGNIKELAIFFGDKDEIERKQYLLHGHNLGECSKFFSEGVMCTELSNEYFPSLIPVVLKVLGLKK